MATKDETRQAILLAAQQLFVRFGPIKTSVADIARELGMSPTNIYNFYSSRDAILEAVGELQLTTLKHRIAREIERAPDGWAKIEILYLTTFRNMRNHLENEKDILQLQAIAKKNDWKFVSDYYRFLLDLTTEIIRDGLESGFFYLSHGSAEPIEPRAAAEALFDCLVSTVDPLMIRKFDQPEHERRVKAQLKLLKRALL
jgi:AcrR family transcriptional regulator